MELLGCVSLMTHGSARRQHHEECRERARPSEQRTSETLQAKRSRARRERPENHEEKSGDGREKERLSALAVGPAWRRTYADSVVPQVHVKCRMIDERPILTGPVRSTSATPQLDMEFLGRRDQGSANVVSQSAGHHESDMQLSSLDASDRFTRKE